ncbi:CHAT domain-containing protein [Streptomyces sp. Wh19]|uniref:CHAT domain-containing protein n=1 Tax=Streptomyces sp. Wh19 TaxID=3076629 RepID=UPI002958683B|nr:CHAT domain-containing protein [Streptomyces sp. Wh19]MDV9196793.1 CHAT domain-containing protein [Streptomyces sp. Wh19]
MTHEPGVEVLENPSHGFTGVPPQRGGSQAGAVDGLSAELHVKLYRSGTGLSILAHGTSVHDTGAWHQAPLEVSADELLDRADRLLAIWRDQVVFHRNTGSGYGQRVGGRSLAESVDLTELRELTDPLVEKLADEGFDLLQVMLDGTGYDLRRFREFLLGTLAEGQQLRISFDSEWQLPWTMLAVDPAECDSPWEAFLGHRHQVEQARTGYAWDHAPLGRRERATVSLNKDTTLDHVARAHEVQKLLEERALLTVRTRGSELLEALSRSVLHEDVMYFWCHGHFVNTGASSQVLTIRLSDAENIDGPVVKRKRRSYLRSPQSRFKPFVLLNACHSAKAADPGRLKHLGQELVDQGADGVLAPQIEIPEAFAAEYAYAFLDRYLTGAHTAGAIGQWLVRRFAQEFHNPLALVYSLNGGINTRLDLIS